MRTLDPGRPVDAQVGNEIVLCIAGNKCDLESRRAVPVDEGAEFAEEKGAIHMETSALAGTNVAALFEEVARRLPRKQLESADPQSSSFPVLESTKNESGGCC